jgi:nucleoside-diphosphate-sugar epimerase
VKVLVTGAFGQIGTELVQALCERHGGDNVLATGRHVRGSPPCHTAVLDILDSEAIDDAITNQNTDVVYHLAAVLSAKAEEDPQDAWHVNVDGWHNVLEAARRHRLTRVFWPSSIAVFGPGSPLDETPQDTVMRPTTIYGVGKVAGELLGDYYARHYGIDIRGVRYPGIISSGAPPGGGTTDYAVEIFHAALKEGRYTAFVREDCALPMLYMPDCIDAALGLMEAGASRLRYRTGYNLAGMSFALGDLVAEIRKHLPDFACSYEPDERQSIADTWPRSIDDSAARDDWGWRPRFDLARMTEDMLHAIGGPKLPETK